MPMYEYQCQKCKDITCSIRPYHMRDVTPACLGCGADEEEVKRKVEMPGYRRDHTVVDGED